MLKFERRLREKVLKGSEAKTFDDLIPPLKLQTTEVVSLVV